LFIPVFLCFAFRGSRYPARGLFLERCCNCRHVVRSNSLLSSRISGLAYHAAAKKTALQRQVDATDKQIDILMYELYGLTKEEIKIVEEG